MDDNKIKINLKRLQYLLKRFDMSEEELLKRVSKDPKKPKRREEVFASTVSRTTLERIDKVFKQGNLAFYVDPAPIKAAGVLSIFFRKQDFNADLTHADRLKINEIERESDLLDLYAKLSDYPLTRTLETFTLDDSPVEAAFSVHERLSPRKAFKSPRDFLKALMRSLGEHNILVLEFLVPYNLTEKPNIEGLFIAPRTIAIRRHPRGFKREIFTLAHELGHYMLESEEVDRTAFGKHESGMERWCNKFAFAFLMGPDDMKRVSALNASDITVVSPLLKELSEEKHTSRLAIAAHLSPKVISPSRYREFSKELEQEWQEWDRNEKLKREKSSKDGNSGGGPKQIREGLERDIYRSALSTGTVEEHDVVKRFGKNMERFVYG